MLPRGHRLSALKKFEPIRNIATVGEYMKAARGSAKGLDDCGDLRTLSSLPWARHRSRGTQVRVVRVYPPTSARACGGVATASVSSDAVDSVRGNHFWEVLG